MRGFVLVDVISLQLQSEYIYMAFTTQNVLWYEQRWQIIKYCASQITVVGMSSLSMYYTNSLLQLRANMQITIFYTFFKK